MACRSHLALFTLLSVSIFTAVICSLTAEESGTQLTNESNTADNISFNETAEEYEGDNEECAGDDCTESGSIVAEPLMETTSTTATKEMSKIYVETIVRPVNMTLFFKKSFNDKKENLPIEIEKNEEVWRECYACYRLAKVHGAGPNGRELLADTCGGSPPRVRCYASKATNKSIASAQVVDGSLAPACAKSYIRENATELIIRGCYSSKLTISSYDNNNKKPSYANLTGQWQQLNTTVSSPSYENSTGTRSSTSKHRSSIKFQQCQNGFGEKGKNRSVYIWCCEDDLCNSEQRVNIWKPQLLLFSIVLLCFIKDF